MRGLVILVALMMCMPYAHSDSSFGQRLTNLEERLESLEAAVSQKLSGCTMKIKRWGTSVNDCPKGTFVTRVFGLDATTNQVTCGYYQLQCSREIEVEN